MQYYIKVDSGCKSKVLCTLNLSTIWALIASCCGHFTLTTIGWEIEWAAEAFKMEIKLQSFGQYLSALLHAGDQISFDNKP
jgi:hypothetical protein